MTSVSSSTSTSTTPASTTSTSTSANSVATAASVIQSLGIGTTLPISQVLAGLIGIESIPLVQLQNQVSGVQTEISAYGTLSSALSTFQTAVQQLTLPSQFGALTATSSDTSVLSATAVIGASLGNTTITVANIAQSQSLATAGQASLNTALATDSSSTSTVTFSFGTENSDGTFTANPAQAGGTVTINSSNDTLSGIRDAINSAGLGVTATIVNDGSSSPYRLVVTSNATGAAQAVQIGVSGDSGISNLLTYPPATGTATGTGVTETQAGKDASLTVNGIALTSASNTVSSSLTGLTLNLTKAGSTTLTVANNSASIQTNIDNFVKSYNDLEASIATLTAYNPTGTNGVLIGDSTVSQIQNSIQAIVSGAVTGTGTSTGYTSLGDVGVTFNADGSLSVDDTTLSTALSTNPSQFAGLFATAGTSTSSNLTYLAGGSSTQAGSYAVNITHAATTATAVGIAAPSASTTFSAATSLSVTLDGVQANVSIPAGTYSASQLATTLQQAINSNSTFLAANLSTNVTVNSSGALQVAGTTYGSTETISIGGDAATSIFGGTPTTTVGTDVAGTIGGAAATGTGQDLVGATGTPAAGLTIQVNGTSIGNLGTINYSQGYASKLNAVIASAISSTGLIATATSTLNTQITALQAQETTTQAYITSVQAQYQAEFSALDATLATLSNTASFLQQTFNPTTTSG